MGAELRGPDAPSLLPVVTYWPEEFGAFPGRQYELTHALARRRPVVALGRRNERTWRAPRVEWRRDGRVDVATLVVTRPVALLARGAPRRASRLLGRIAGRSLRRAGHRSFLFWASVIEVGLAEGLRPAATVYDVIDPPLDDRGDGAFDDALRAAVRSGADFTATAAALAERVAAAGGHATVVPNGCREPRANPVERRSAPFTAVYLGTIDRRVDLPLLVEVARRSPAVRFRIGGRWNRGSESARASLERLPNVEVLGPVPYDQTDHLLASADVGLIPFTPGPIGHAINPVKLYEYLAHGLEVLATPIREVAGCPLASVGATAQEWVALLGELAVRPRRAEELTAYALATTWEHRAVAADRALRAHGGFRPRGTVGPLAPLSDPTVTVAICTGGRASSLRATLDALRPEAVGGERVVEVLVVEHGSPEGAAAPLGADEPAIAPLRRLRVAAPGAARARNAAVMAARGDLVVFLDDDVRPRPGWLPALLAPLVAGAAWASCGLVRIADECRAGLSDDDLRLLGHHERLSEAQRRDPPLVVGNMAFRREVFEHLPGFDVALGAGALGTGEERMLRTLMKELGMRIAAAEDAVVDRHLDPARCSRDHLLAVARAHGRLAAYRDHHWAHRGPSAVLVRLVVDGATLAAARRRARRRRGEGLVDPAEHEALARVTRDGSYLAHVVRRTPRRYPGPPGRA